MNIKIIWTDRYSRTDEPDNHNRWARVGYLTHKDEPLKNMEIAWINKVELKNKTGFFANLYIGNNKYSAFDKLEEAKEYCEKELNEFYSNYLSVGF